MKIHNLGAQRLLEDLPFWVAVLRRGHGTQVRVTTLMKQAGVAKGDVQKALKWATEQLEHARRPPERPVQADWRYEVREGGIVKVREDLGEDGELQERVVLLTNFSACVTRDEYVLTGAEPIRRFCVEAYVGGEKRIVKLAPDELQKPNWVLAKLGSKARVLAGVKSDELRDAIQSLSAEGLVEQRVYGHTGWAEVDGTNVFLHAAGAIGGEDVEVELQPPFERYELGEWDPASGVEDIRASAGMLDVASLEISVPLFCAMYRAPTLSFLPCDTSLFLVGRTGSRKSTLAALALSHFRGRLPPRGAPLPDNWESTAAALEHRMFVGKDVPFVIDDFAPRASDQNDPMRKKADQIFRNIGNGASRARMRHDMTARADLPPRALVITTAEDVPAMHSILARQVIVNVEAEKVDVARLTELQSNFARLSRAMTGYIRWLAERVDELASDLRSHHLALCDAFAVPGGHARSPSALAHLALGAELFVAFAVERGALNEVDGDSFFENARNALSAVGSAQTGVVAQADPVDRFMEVLSDLIVQGKVRLASQRDEDLASFGGVEAIGWRDSKKRRIYLLATATYTVVQKAAVPIPLVERTLWKRMNEKGLLTSVGPDRLTVQRTVGKNKEKLWVLELAFDALPVGGTALVEDASGPGHAHPRADRDATSDDAASRHPNGPSAHQGAGEGKLGCTRPQEASTRAPHQQEIYFTSFTKSREYPHQEVSSGSNESEEKTFFVAGLPGHGGTLPETGESVTCTSPQAGACTWRASSALNIPGLRLDEAGDRSGATGDGSPGATHSCGVPTLPSGELGASGRTEIPDLVTRLRVARSVVAELNEERSVLAVLLPSGERRDVPLETLARDANLREALASLELVGHRLKPTLRALLSRGLGVRAVWDTELAARLVDAGQHCDTDSYFDLPAVVARFGTPPPPRPTGWRRWVRTAENMVESRLRSVANLRPVLESRVATDGLADAVKLECDLLPVIAAMEHRGVQIDREGWEGHVTAMRRRRDELAGALKEELRATNLAADAEVLRGLRLLGIEVERTGADALAAHTQHDTVNRLIEYRQVCSFLDGLGRAILDGLDRRNDGRVSGDIRQLGSATGRMSCRAPNLMGVPKTHEVRRLVRPAEDHVFVVADYAAIDLRVLADVAGDDALRRVFEQDGDPHASTAAALLHKPLSQVNAQERRLAKAINFGVVFGMGAESLCSYAFESYGIPMDVASAEELTLNFRRTYRGVARFQGEAKRSGERLVRSKSGRLRVISREEYPERVNTPVQGTAADGMKRSMVVLSERLRPLGAHIVLCVHDELVVEAPRAHAADVLRVVEAAMIEGMREYVKSVPIKLKAEVRRTWAEEEN